jgi:hypothetical protein
MYIGRGTRATASLWSGVTTVRPVTEQTTTNNDYNWPRREDETSLSEERVVSSPTDTVPRMLMNRYTELC